MATTGYEGLGFAANPFNSNTAEREPEIAAYAVHPPYLDRTEQASLSSGVFFLEGARGSGKSATRLTVAKRVFKGPGSPLVVPLISFNVFKPYLKTGLPLELFVSQIAFLVVETLLSWMASLPEEEQKKLQGTVQPNEKLISKFVSNFYLNRADHSRSNSSTETFQLLDTSIGGRASLWKDQRWDQLAGVVARLASVFGQKYADVDIGDPGAFQKLIEHQKGDGFYDPTYTLTRAVEIVRIFGFSGLLIQIDKVDETEWTGADPDAAASLILPLLANIGLHEIAGLTWTFFVWDEVSKGMRKNHGTKIRFDKIPNGEIVWEVKYLTDLVSRRMSFFSNSRVKTLADISESGTDVGALLNDLIELTSRSPRQLISALDHILSTHIQRNQGNPKLLDFTAYQSGMDSYAVKSLDDSGLLEEAKTIAKMRLTTFVTKDVQGLIRQSAPSARGRIDAWIHDRLVRSNGARPTGAGRPVDEFIVSDPRAVRLVSRGL